jgi:hypothetical protein
MRRTIRSPVIKQELRKGKTSATGLTALEVACFHLFDKGEEIAHLLELDRHGAKRSVFQERA